MNFLLILCLLFCGCAAPIYNCVKYQTTTPCPKPSGNEKDLNFGWACLSSVLSEGYICKPEKK